jgi:hypothetical protein
MIYNIRIKIFKIVNIFIQNVKINGNFFFKPEYGCCIGQRLECCKSVAGNCKLLAVYCGNFNFITGAYYIISQKKTGNRRGSSEDSVYDLVNSRIPSQAPAGCRKTP